MTSSVHDLVIRLFPHRFRFSLTWLIPVRKIVASNEKPLIWMNPPPAPPRQFGLVGPRLQPILESRPLQPHEIVRGWVLLDVPAPYDSAPSPTMFRITIKDTAGHTLVTTDSGTNGDENIGPPRGFHLGDEVNTRGFVVRHLADPPK